MKFRNVTHRVSSFNYVAFGASGPVDTVMALSKTPKVLDEPWLSSATELHLLTDLLTVSSSCLTGARSRNDCSRGWVRNALMTEIARH